MIKFSGNLDKLGNFLYNGFYIEKAFEQKPVSDVGRFRELLSGEKQ